MAKTSGKKPSLKAQSARRAEAARGKKLKGSAPDTAKITRKNSAKAPVARLAAKPAAKAKFALVKPGFGSTASKKALVSKGKEPNLRESSVKIAARSSKAAMGDAKVAAPLKKNPIVANPTPVVAPVATANGKPGKNPAGLSARELDHFRELLLAKRRELIGDMSSMESEALRNNGGSNLSNLPIHMADMGTDNYEQEFTLGLVQKDRDLLKEINAALSKIKLGTYGICEATDLPITKERLEFQPWVRFSMEHQRKLERHGR